MREILFRGKNKVTNDWVEGLPITYADGVCTISVPQSDDLMLQYVVDAETLGQFTGLIDKNGRRIFEGDILEASNGNRGCVIFDNGAFMKLCNPKDMPFLIAAAVNKIIGNVHDNPEMLDRE